MKRLGAAAMVCALAGSGAFAADPPVQHSTIRAPVHVTAVAPTARRVDQVLTALGTVESATHPTVAAEVSGRITSLSVEEGDQVERGELLGTIDNELYRIGVLKARSELARQQAQFDYKHAQVGRLMRLAEQQAIARDRLEDEQAQLRMIKAQRDLAGQQLQEAALLESRTRVLAPVAGVVARRHVSVGDHVDSTQPLFALVAVARLRARLTFPEHESAKLRVGIPASLRSPVAPDTEVHGAITSINPQINGDGRAIDVLVEFGNPGGWRPGASVDANLLLGERVDALTVPASSVLSRSGGDVLFVILDRVAREHKVVLGSRDADWVEIRSGIRATDLVIVDGASMLDDGSPVALETDAGSP